MRVLILGGGGMLGHKLYQAMRDGADVFVTLRRSAAAYSRYDFFSPSSVIDGVDAANSDHLHRTFAATRPDAVINCVGIIKQLKEAHDPLTSITINSLLPHRLAGLAAACGARLVHISTDCVFSGKGGPYTESSLPDAEDLYGRSKLLGETDGTQEPNAITVRTSIIGRELGTASGLVEWFLSQRGGEARGYTNALYTGLTTIQLSKIIADILFSHHELRGLWQVSSDPISKFDLLSLINQQFDADVRLAPDPSFQCDRRLDSARFRAATGFSPASWPDMIEEMKHDPTPYELWRTR
jgi:dTDP-4-dehydrorhamnose reductase